MAGKQIRYANDSSHSTSSHARRLAEESELSTDDIFWSKQEEDLQQQQMQAAIYPSLPVLTSPPSQQHKTLTPSTPAQTAQQVSTPNTLMKSSPSSIGTLRARAHNFISRNILIPETCCVVNSERDDASHAQGTPVVSSSFSASNGSISVN